MEVSSPILPTHPQWLIETKDSHDWLDSTNRSVVCPSWDHQDLSWPLFLEDSGTTAYQQPKRVSMDTCDTSGAFLDDPMLFDYANDWCGTECTSDEILSLIPPDDNDERLLHQQFEERRQQLAACMQKTRESRACLHQREVHRPELKQVWADIEKSTQAIQEAMDVVDQE